MKFKSHSDLEGQHAFLSASKYHWINYDEEKLSSAYLKHLATLRGTELHDLACRCIKLGVKLPNNNKTINHYVNDAINYRMTPEQVLYYSENCFGTADTICFRKNLLRIHDLKTGSSQTSIHQLEVYAALFCLEYNYKPQDINMELRIYQSDDVLVSIPDPLVIDRIMDKIILFDKQIEKIKSEG